MDLEEEQAVSIRRLPDEDLSVREVRISCPDATGLGVDLTRMLLDFGLRILKGDISTDGKFCFLIFKVQLSSGVPPRWTLLRQRLEGICPSGADELRQLWRWRSMPKEQPPFLLQVASYDRQGMLHSLTHALWESDTTVFKAHITTSPSGEVADLFWLYDNKNELPETHRALEICDRVKGVLGPDAECTIASAPADSVSPDPSHTSALHRRACKDATSTASLRTVVSRRKLSSSSRLHSSDRESSGSLPSPSGDSGELGAAAGAGEAAAAGPGAADSAAPKRGARESYAEQQAAVELSVDNETSHVYSMLTLRCQDRKGLLYDLFRSLKDIDFRVAYGRIEVYEGGLCEVDLFIQDAECCRISDPELLAELTRRVRTAVALPVRIDIRDAFDATCTELTVTAAIDSGGRGRPRVTFDVTQGLSVAGVGVFMADVYIERLDPLALDAEHRAQEMHRFLVHLPNGKPILSQRDRQAIYEVVRAHLMGTSSTLLEKNRELAAAAGGGPLPGHLGNGHGNGHHARRASNGGGDASLLQGLSHKWFG